MTATTGAAQPTSPNRERHDYSPIKDALIYTRRAHPKSPTELVISYGGTTVMAYELTRKVIRKLCRELHDIEFSLPDPE